ncbi:MAG: helix-turn-helix transcriptional regulator [Oscillospiraceae bacterium]|nr:helix-turn-helix transcriptional regulator [Oscillospiraceae bacterium]
MNLGEAIRNARTAKGMTQEALAEMIGVVPQTVSKWERNESQPDTELLSPLADALGISLDRLFDRQSGSWEDAREALLRWLPRWEEESRQDQIMTLMTFAFQYLMGRWDKDNKGPDPFDFGPLYPADGWDYTLLGDEMLALLGTKKVLPFGLFLGEGPEGWGSLFEDPDLLAPVFDVLGDRDCRRVLLRRLSVAGSASFLREEAGEVLGVEDPEAVISRLQKLRMVSIRKARIDGEETELLHFQADVHILAILLLARACFGPEGNAAGMSGMGRHRFDTPPLRRKVPEGE